MECVNLPTGVGINVEKTKILLVLQDVIDANNGNVDMRAIAAKHRLNRQEKRAIEDYLKKYMFHLKMENQPLDGITKGLEVSTWWTLIVSPLLQRRRNLKK